MGLKIPRHGNKSYGTSERTVMQGVTREETLADAVRVPQTPSEWLLARYDRVLRRAHGPQGDARRIRYDRGSNFDRPLFDVIDDHPGAECEQAFDGKCAYTSDDARWPVAELADDLDTNTFVADLLHIA
jgi:hypothetical protein